MQSNAQTVQAYLEELPPDRREAIAALREVVLQNLPAGYEEVMNWGMITYQVPISVYPDTYNKQPLMYAALASQKNHMALYVLAPYAVPGALKDLQDGFAAAGKKLDMGKSCIRFKNLADLPLDVIARTIALIPMADYLAHEKALRANR